MSDEAMECVADLARAICVNQPRVRDFANALGPRVAGLATQAATGNQAAGSAVDLALTTLGAANPNKGAEVIVGLALTPVFAVALVAAAPLMFGILAVEGGKGLLNWLDHL
jgi:hypothetical protein